MKLNLPWTVGGLDIFNDNPGEFEMCIDDSNENLVLTIPSNFTEKEDMDGVKAEKATRELAEFIVEAVNKYGAKK